MWWRQAARTGFGGEKVVVHGGVMVIPVFHALMQVRLTTVTLEVARLNKDALITLDKRYADAVVAFGQAAEAQEGESLFMLTDTPG